MKKKHDTIESLLKTGKHTGLTVSEQEEMWSALTSYAAFHPMKQPSSRVSQKYMSVSKWAGAFVVMILFIGTSTLSLESRPGESLYDVKVNIVEPLIGLMQMSEVEQLNYELSLLDRRLVEMKEISQLGLLDEEAIQDIEEEIEDRSEVIVKMMDEEKIAASVKLKAIAETETAVRTYKYIEDTKYDRARKSKLETKADDLQALYATEVQDFIAEDPTVAVEYLHTVLVELDSTISNETASTTISGSIEIYDYLEDAKQALEEGEIDNALEYANEAYQVIDFNEQIEEIIEEGQPVE